MTEQHGRDEVRLRLEHVAIAVENLETACEEYSRLLGISASSIEEVESERVRLAFFELDGCRLELLEGTGDDSPIRKFLASGRRGVHHLAFTVDGEEIDATLDRLRAAGVPLLDDAPRTGAEESKVVFVHPRAASGVLTEFTKKAK